VRSPLAAELYHYRDLVIVVGQSNCGCYGDFLSVWPAREQQDRNWSVQNHTIDDDWHAGDAVAPDGFSSATPRGYLALSLAAQMRYSGLRPSICTVSIGGVNAADLRTAVTSTWAAYIAARVSTMVAPRSVNLVWSQGEAMLYEGTASTWQADTAASVSAIRTALGMPALHLTVIQLAATYTPGPEMIDNPGARAAQASLVAADAYASIVGVADVATVTSNIHLGQYDLDRQAKLVAADIKSRISV
jgi:hypothetical protein